MSNTRSGPGDTIVRTVGPSAPTLGGDSWEGCSGELEQPHFPVGTEVNGRYVVDAVLGEGGMGVVYRVQDPLHPDRPLALKTILGSVLDEDRLGMFKAEFATMTQLSHPNIASVYDFEAVAGSDDYLFTLEYVRGKDLYRATRDADIPTVVELLVQISRALAYMHSRDVVHFDLKPANVLVTDDGVAKVLDFGLAGARARAEQGSAFGTPSYMAPELAQGGAVDHRADLYCLGIMAYQLLCRRLPFAGDSLVTLAFHHCYTPVSFDDEDVERIPAWLREIVVQLCAKEPADRFRTANDVIDTINREGGAAFELETQETRESYILSSRFVGRDEELSRISEFVTGRREGRGGKRPMLVVGGQSGIGKTRLMREVRYRAQLARHSFVETNCYEGVRSEFDPIGEALRRVVRIAESTGQEMLVEKFAPELIRLAPEIADELTTFHGAAPDAPERERARMMEAVAEFLVRVADKHPYILYVNDLHWAQAGTVDVLGHVIRIVSILENRGEPAKLALLGSFRDDEYLGRPVEDLIDALQRRDERSIVRLRALDQPQIARLLGSMLGLVSIPEAFTERVFHETAGNPFFVEEVMRALVENGSVFLEGGQWAAREEIVDLDIPASVTNVFLHRLASLDPSARLVLEHMAVYGRPVTVKVLQRTTELSPDELFATLKTLAHRQMVLRMPDDELSYRVTHDRIRETLYAEMLPAERRRVHQTTANALEEIYADDLDDQLYALADHTWHAERWDQASGYCRAAGDKAKEAYENALAVEFYRRAMELLPEGAEELRLQLVENLADLYLLLGRYDDCLACLTEVLAVTDDALGCARLERKIGRIYWQTGELQRSIDHCWRAVELLGERRFRSMAGFLVRLAIEGARHALHLWFPKRIRQETDPERVTLLLELSAAYLGLMDAYFVHDATYMPLPVLRATNLAERAPMSKELCEGYTNAGFVYVVMTLFGVGKKMLDRSLDIARQLGRPWHIAYASVHRAWGHVFMTEFDEAIELASQAKRTFLARGDESQLTFAFACEFFARMYKGQIPQAEQCAAEGLDTLAIVAQKGGMKIAGPLISSLSWARALQGQREPALQEIRNVAELLADAKDKIPLGVTQVQLGSSLLALGDVEEAIDCLEQARATKEDNHLVYDTLVWIYPLLARAYLERYRELREIDEAGARGCLQRARRMARRSVKLSRRYATYRSPALLADAAHAWYSGRHDRARARFDESIQAARAAKSSWMLADAHYEAGRCMGEDDDLADIAATHLEVALRLYRQMNMRPYVDRIRGNGDATLTLEVTRSQIL